MGEQHEYRFIIDAYSPDTIPMARLAEYMAELARLLGRPEHVHFTRLEAGSTVVVQSVEPDAVPEVTARLRALEHGNPHGDVARAFKTLNGYLADDDATGRLQEGTGASANVIPFPGMEASAPATFGALTEPGMLDGILIRIGGKEDTVPVHLRDGDTIHICSAPRDMARKLAVHLYGPPLRVHGTGRWERAAAGRWTMKRFNIESFEELDDAPLEEIVQRLRDVEGSGWKTIEDPIAVLRNLRGDD